MRSLYHIREPTYMPTSRKENSSGRNAAAPPGNRQDSDELDAFQLSDSMFPTGMFASSGGLESMFTKGMITDARSLSSLCKDMIERQMAVSDCVALAVAYDATESGDIRTVEEIDAACSSMKTVMEAREASVRSGIQLCRCVLEFCHGGKMLERYTGSIRHGDASGVYPVALGVCCRTLKIGKRRSILMFLYGFVANMAGAALRLGMIQHFEAQKMIHELKPVMREAAATSVTMRASDMWQFCPHAEILQMAHERMDEKMFIT